MKLIKIVEIYLDEDDQYSKILKDESGNLYKEYSTASGNCWYTQVSKVTQEGLVEEDEKRKKIRSNMKVDF